MLFIIIKNNVHSKMKKKKMVLSHNDIFGNQIKILDKNVKSNSSHMIWNPFQYYSNYYVKGKKNN